MMREIEEKKISDSTVTLQTFNGSVVGRSCFSEYQRVNSLDLCHMIETW